MTITNVYYLDGRKVASFAVARAEQYTATEIRVERYANDVLVKIDSYRPGDL